MKKELSELVSKEDLDGLINSHELTNYQDKYSKAELFYIEVRLSKYFDYVKWKSYKNSLINTTKEKLLECLSKSVQYNDENPDNKCIRKLNKKALVDKNIISIFESTLTRTLEIPKDELSEDIFVVQVYYFDVIKDLILNGFEHNGEKYRFLTASAGQIRTKKTVFIKESQWNKHQKSLMCGLTLDDINAQGGVNVNKFLAYLALSNSATDQWVDFDIDKCIVIPDFETEVNGDVDFIDEQTYQITRQNMNIAIEHTDGCGMILPSVSKKNFMVRLPWVKGLLGVFDFRKFIEEYECSPLIEDIYGDVHNIIEEDIQIIFTKSQFKMQKYYSNWDSYKDNFKKHNCQAGVCNVEEDKIPQANINYQMLQSLTDITPQELHTIAEQSINKLENMTSSVGNLLNVLGATPEKKYKTPLQEALLLYPELLSDPYCKNNIKAVQKSLVKSYKAGRLEVNGKYLFIVPDLYAACEYWFKGDKNPKGLLANKQVACKIYKKKDKLACLRSPHLYREWAIRENIYNDEIEKWLNTSAVYTSCHDLISKLLQFD